MEPSLHSSTQRGNECKLRKTDPAAHEATKRFVESLRNDVRISQYADMNFAAKKFDESREPWYWLTPVPGGRTGFLVFLPDQPAVWMDDQAKTSLYVQMRVGVATYEKTSVFLASLNKFDGLLRLEDAWVIAGKHYTQTPFTQRWDDVLSFYNGQYKSDTQLQQGLRIEVAEYMSLGSIRNWHSSAPNIMYAQGEKFPRRLRVQLSSPTLASAPAPAPAPAPPPRPLLKQKQRPPPPSAQLNVRPMFVDDDAPAPTDADSSIALAVAHEEHPDTYNLIVNGVKKGYAAVQDLDLSREMRAACKESSEVYVKIEWNTEFNMYEIMSRVLSKA